MICSGKLLLSILVLLFIQPTFSQSFKIGSIDIYGNRSIKTSTVAASLPVKAGDSINHDNFKVDEVTAKLKQLPGVKYATVNPICCDTAGNMMLFIGIGETDDAILILNPAPAEDVQLPADMMATYNTVTALLDSAVMQGQSQEDDTSGYSLSSYKPARDEQLKFIGYAKEQFALLVNVLKNSKFEDQRAAAAEILPYADNKEEIVAHLLPAVNDIDEGVRNNATRALGILASYALVHPQLEIDIPAAQFIKMINSVVWTDRNKGASVLLPLTQKRNAFLLFEIKQGALPSIIEMAQWADRSHAIYAYVILGRIAGLDEEYIVQKNFSPAWPDGITLMLDAISRRYNRY